VVTNASQYSPTNLRNYCNGALNILSRLKIPNLNELFSNHFLDRLAIYEIPNNGEEYFDK